MTHDPRRGNRLLIAIGAFKLVKGILLILVGIGSLALLHRDVEHVVLHAAQWLNVSQDNRFVVKLLGKVGVLDAKHLEEIAAGTFFYAALLLTEGIGLLMRKHWAEYLTVFITASLIPVEVVEFVKGVSATKIGVFIINVAIVAYLVARLIRERGRRSAQAH